MPKLRETAPPQCRDLGGNAVTTGKEAFAQRARIRRKQVMLIRDIADRIALVYPLHTLRLHPGQNDYPASVIVKVLPKTGETRLDRQDRFCHQIEISVHSPLEKWPRRSGAIQALHDSRPHQVSLRSSARDNFGAVYKIRPDLSFSDKLLGRTFEYINEQMDLFAARDIQERATRKTENEVAMILKDLGYAAAGIETTCYPDGMVEVSRRTTEWEIDLPGHRIWPEEIGAYIGAANRYVIAVKPLGRPREDDA